jgi:hypothetical protein
MKIIDWIWPCLQDHFNGSLLCSKAEFDSRINSLLTPETAFQAGRCHGFYEVWEAFLIRAGFQHSKNEELTWLKNGIPLRMVHADDPQKISEPHHEQRVTVMTRALREIGVDSRNIQENIHGSHPAPLVFPNRLGSPESEDNKFARKQIQRDLQRGTLLRWPFKGYRPAVILPLAVVRTPGRKPRLIIDARYTNLFLQYFPFHYEQVRDAVCMMESHGYNVMATFDFKSGYHHLMFAT